MFELDSKKSVRVCVRCRPRNDKELRLEGGKKCLRFTSDRLKVVVSEGKEFIFDNVFDDSSNQQQIFEYCARNLVDGLFFGFNATIFAYGQTGSGKTHTMYGRKVSVLTSDEEGIIPRALRYMFQSIETEHQTKSVQLKVSFLEIYNDEIRDLLHLDIPSAEITIREDGDGRIFFTGAKEEIVNDIRNVFSLLEQGSLARSTAETLMNESSSRSHAIFTVNLDILEAPREDDESGVRKASTRVLSKLQLVDLAGSERAKRTGAVGQRLKESVGINQGLLALGKVIRALTQPTKGGNTGHIPYRESKLTRFLQDSLGGNSHTVMLACVSPVDSSLAETLSTLQYASLARAVQNRLVANVETRVVDTEIGGSEGWEMEVMRVQLARAKAEVLRLKKEEALQSLSASMQAGPNGWSDLSGEAESQLRLRLRKIWSTVLQVRQELHSAANNTASMNGACQRAVAVLGKIADESEDQQAVVDNEASVTAVHRELELTRRELEECQEDLRRDEVIFSEKVQELRQLKKQLRRLQKDHETVLSHRSGSTDVAGLCPVCSGNSGSPVHGASAAEELRKRLAVVDRLLEDKQAQLSRLWKESEDGGERGGAACAGRDADVSDEIEKLYGERKGLWAKLKGEEAKGGMGSHSTARSESLRSQECFSRSTDGSVGTVDADSLAGDFAPERLSRHEKSISRDELGRQIDKVIAAEVGRMHRQRLKGLLEKSEGNLRQVKVELERARKELDGSELEDAVIQELQDEKEIVASEVALYRRRLREEGDDDKENMAGTGFQTDKDGLLRLLQNVESTSSAMLLLYTASELLDLKLRVAQEASSSETWRVRCEDLELIQLRLQDASRKFRTDMAGRLAAGKAEHDAKVAFLLQQLRDSEAQVRALEGSAVGEVVGRAHRPHSAGALSSLSRPPKLASNSGDEDSDSVAALESENAKLKHWLQSERQRREQMEKRNGELTREIRALREHTASI